jgi:hypothetical protein
MQAFLDKYTRLQVDHQVFGNSDLFQLILSYLDPADLSACTHVSFRWRSVVYSNPYMEISILKYRLNNANKALHKLRKKEKVPAKPKPDLVVPSFDVGQHLHASISRLKNSKAKPQPSKWKNFIDDFFKYAKDKSFPAQSQSDLSGDDWILYSNNLENFVNHYVEEIMHGKKWQRDSNTEVIAPIQPAGLLDRRMKVRIDYEPKPKRAEESPSFFKNLSLKTAYNNLKDELNVGFHFYTGFRYFDAEKEIRRIQESRAQVQEAPVPKQPTSKTKEIDINYLPI